MKNSLSRRLFQKYGLPPRGYQWGATSFLPTQGILNCAENYNITPVQRIQGDLGKIAYFLSFWCATSRKPATKKYKIHTGDRLAKVSIHCDSSQKKPSEIRRFQRVWSC